MSIFKKISVLAQTVLLAVCCGETVPDGPGVLEHLVSEVDLPEKITAAAGSSFTIAGKGFEAGDVMLFSPTGGTDVEMPTTAVGKGFASFTISASLENGRKYAVSVRRGGRSEMIGNTTFYLMGSAEGNISGTVTAGGTPLEGVLVSDGVEIVATDANGRYTMQSAKKYMTVFVITPSGYEPAYNDGLGDYWHSLVNDNPGVKETVDFELVKCNNDRHTVVMTADWHLANRFANTASWHDIRQCTDTYKASVNALASEVQTPLYSFALGDLSWDSFWYSGMFQIADWRDYIRQSPMITFPVIGNHDHDYSVSGANVDLRSSAPFRKAVGPTFYSMNIGKVHYIVLDSIINDNLDGTTAGRIHKEGLDDDQIAFLRKDLQYVPKTTPVVLMTHVPLFRLKLSGRSWTVSESMGGEVAKVINILKDYETVHILGGHSHVHANFNLAAEGKSTHTMTSRIVPALGGTLWTTMTTGGINITTDGNPQGYLVYEANGRNISWHYRPISYGKSGTELGRDAQFRVYDMNQVREFWQTNAQVRNAVAKDSRYAYERLWTETPDNTIFINVFCGDPFQREMRIEVYEGNNRLETTILPQYDPLHLLAYEIPQIDKTGKPFDNTAYQSVNSTHIFRCQASSATSTITVKVTDAFGRTYTQTITRPKPFSIETLN